MGWLSSFVQNTLTKNSIATPSRLKESGILSMNSRNLNYISRYNPRRLLPLVDDKLTTKRMAEKAGVDVPKLIGVIEYQSDIRKLKSILEPLEQFVIKPAKGSGGKGILVITGRDGDRYVKASGESLSFNAISRDVSNILGGLYSLGGKSDVAVIESLIVADPIFKDYSFEGVPDIRVIVFRGFPVMAMMRLATRKSDGKANLHQGAVGVGLDIATGNSLRSVQHDLPVNTHPDTGHNFSTLKVPHWHKILCLSAACHEMTSLGYLGVDLVLDKNLGPLILELNARPGLAIQIANGQGIKPRLEMIESLRKHDLPIEERVAFSQQHFGVSIMQTPQKA
ncbi:alpha-L-glutamate ligase-like protein [Endozoicomonas sp. SESOKO1]|uniref:alpha-L-glutamate ligase-like protein n=1 Tax=Endozoicomonas sp. SESOKO1 TaxID=2828742 RepID=UPI002147A782|nr:alpha-L-glutamate ligase-like protein [Endozoicomonas sp. SESOKO1]